jgi:hypothetical protein
MARNLDGAALDYLDMTISAANFGLGERLSPAAQAGVAVAKYQINRLVHAGNQESSAGADRVEQVGPSSFAASTEQ